MSTSKRSTNIRRKNKSTAFRIKNVSKFLTNPIRKPVSTCSWTMRRGRKSIDLYLNSGDGKSVFLMSAQRTLSGFTMKSINKDEIARLTIKRFGTMYSLSDSTRDKEYAGHIQFFKTMEGVNKGCRETMLVLPDDDEDDTDAVQTFENVAPKYNKESKGFVLPLGQFAVISVKNTVVKRGRKTIWSVVKMAPDEFKLNMAGPLSPMQAFGFGVAALHMKY